MKILSVSVAAYNAEAFLHRCLDSFVESGVMEKIQIIVTDDGSADQTPNIVESYRARYPESILLIRQKNQGPGSTVNNGIRSAEGKYFRMVDADDWVDPASFAALVKALEETDADAVIHEHVLVDHETMQEEPVFVTGLPANQLLSFSEVAEGLEIAMHDLVVRTSILQEHVEVDTCFYTDMQYLIFPTRYWKTVLYLPLPVYRYRVSLSSQSMHPKSMQKNLPQHEKVLLSLLSYLKEYETSPEAEKSVVAYLAARIEKMAGNQLSVYLSFPPTKEAKRRVISYLDELPRLSPSVAAILLRRKTARILRLCPFFYSMICRLHRRRLRL